VDEQAVVFHGTACDIALDRAIPSPVDNGGHVDNL